MATAFWLFFRHHLFDAEANLSSGGDESIVTKAGKTTYGLDRFFSSLGNQSLVPAFFALSLVHVGERRSYPLW